MAAFTIEQKVRPCFAYGDKALFHCWFNVSQIIPPSALKGGHGGGVVSDVCGLVEYPSGRMERVDPRHIQFLNSENIFEQYDWGVRDDG